MKNEKQTIIILTPGFPADENDGNCLPAQQNFVRSLQEIFPGIHVIVLAFQYPYFKKNYKWHGIDVISFGGKNRRRPLRYLLWRNVKKKIHEICKENNVIGLLSFWLDECALIGKWASRKYAIKHFCWLRGQDARNGNKYVKKIQPSGNELIALSDFLQTEFEKNYSIRPAYVVPPGIDPKQFGLENKIKDIDVLGAGSLIPLKQYDRFVYIISEMKKKLPAIKTFLCGKGPDDIKLRQQIKRMGLEENIALTGELPHLDVLKLMQRSKLFLHTSSYEGFGGVCLEALYAGAEVISFCKPMNPDIQHWHIVKNEEEMIKKAMQVFFIASKDSELPEIFYIDETARAIMKLYLHKEVIAS